jgi:hypothetical protein
MWFEITLALVGEFNCSWVTYWEACDVINCQPDVTLGTLRVWVDLIVHWLLLITSDGSGEGGVRAFTHISEWASWDLSAHQTVARTSVRKTLYQMFPTAIRNTKSLWTKPPSIDLSIEIYNKWTLQIFRFLSNFVELSTSSGKFPLLDSNGTLELLFEPNVYCSIHKKLLLVPIQSQMNPVIFIKDVKKVKSSPRNRPWRSIAALSNAAPAIYFSGALRKHIIWADY